MAAESPCRVQHILSNQGRVGRTSSASTTDSDVIQGGCWNALQHIMQKLRCGMRQSARTWPQRCKTRSTAHRNLERSKSRPDSYCHKVDTNQLPRYGTAPPLFHRLPLQNLCFLPGLLLYKVLLQAPIPVQQIVLSRCNSSRSLRSSSCFCRPPVPP